MAILLVDDLGSAEDVVQDAFIGLHRNQENVRDPEAALGYLRPAVVNGARSMLRRRQTVRKHLRRVQPVAGAAPDSELLLAEEHREVLAAVRTLPPGQQEVLVLLLYIARGNDDASAMYIDSPVVGGQCGANSLTDYQSSHH